MATDVQIAIAAVGAIPGVVALIGCAVGYGRLVQRLQTVERDLAEVKDLKEKVSAIDERTKNTQADVRDVKTDVGRLVEHMLGEQRSFMAGRGAPRTR